MNKLYENIGRVKPKFLVDTVDNPHTRYLKSLPVPKYMPKKGTENKPVTGFIEVYQ